MKKILILILIIALGAGIYYGLKKGESTDTREETFGSLSFKYPENFVPVEQNISGNKMMLVMQKSDYESLLNGEREGGEGPASVSLQEFPNPQNLSAKAWADANPQLSNISLLQGSVSEAKVADQAGILYEADGLYASRNIAISLGNKIYLIRGEYLEQGSDLYQAFDKVVDSIEIVR